MNYNRKAGVSQKNDVKAGGVGYRVNLPTEMMTDALMSRATGLFIANHKMYN